MTGVHSPQSGVSVRSAFRQEVRELALQVATRELTEVGWDQVRFGKVASQVGVSRPTLYAEFGNKDELGEALVQYEAQRFMSGISAVLEASHPTPQHAVREAVIFTLDEAELSPVTRAILTSSAADGRTSDSLLPFITTRAAPVMEAVNSGLLVWFSQQCAATPLDEVAESVDVVVRVVVSFLLDPQGDNYATADRVGRLAAKLLPELARS